MSADPRTLSVGQQAGSSARFDVVVAGALLVASSPVLLAGWLAATVETRQNGLFRQVRIGRDGEPFEVLKIRTMRAVDGRRHDGHHRGTTSGSPAAAPGCAG